MIALQDLVDFSEIDVLQHLATEYSGTYQNDFPSDEEIKRSFEDLQQYEVLVAYESVGAYGCDSSSFFLLKHKVTGEYFEIHGSHCSCYGFEGQLDLEETSPVVLKQRIENGGNIFYCGGYDNNETSNQRIVNNFIKEL